MGLIDASLGCHCIEGVAEMDDLCLHRDLATGNAPWISCSIMPFMMVSYELSSSWTVQFLTENAVANVAVGLNHKVLG